MTHNQSFPPCAAVIPAGGSGLRMAADLPKQYLLLAGKPVLVHTLEALGQCPLLTEIVLVVPEPFLDYSRELVQRYKLTRVTQIVPGGSLRQDSVLAGVRALSPEAEYVLVHDGVRPLVDPNLIANCLQEAQLKGAVFAAIPVKDTLKSVSTDQRVMATVDREGLWQAQTPQVARRDLLTRALEAAERIGFEGTDEASLLERLGIPVHVVLGSVRNLKITHPDDLYLAEGLLSKHDPGATMTHHRIGHGYDAHRLVKDRPLILGGVTIPHPTGLLGHSDADVLLHALGDALLGAAGLGDLGRHFPDTDPHYKDANSLELLATIMAMVSTAGFGLTNADITVQAQRPRLSAHFPEMILRISKACRVLPEQINLKATTTERMGFIGREEGIAAHAVVLLHQTGP
ncbi:MAG: 2-C-methyl-D-erythritol 4-phosphate cytidylyltransferase [Proteobacteria bacterium]|nr:2-C-methyl-D-erythritol 4-phosphate cytidylyltransferase [Pseudomonadota bacterium]MBU1685770.1 2-C-methyl-D-erythritol 4-phosphate cytidylyltransferase [Pseudomonadota bacterium]